MRPYATILSILAMLLAAGPATAQSHTGEWVSYRDAYRQMVVFEKYGKPKHLLQSTLQVAPRERSASFEGLRLTLVGRATELNLPLDPAGRTVFPLLKAAYDDNAVLALNQNPGLYAFRPRITIVTRADGVYEAAELRAACQQALDFARYARMAGSDQKCAGVRFAFAPRANAQVRLRDGQHETTLPSVRGAAFADGTSDTFRVVDYRFASAPSAGTVATVDAPLLISPLFE